MPRVAIKKKDYKIVDFRKWLIAELKIRKIRQDEVGEWLGVSQQAVSAKLRTGAFSLKEIIILFEKLDTEPEKIGSLLKV